MTPTPSPSLGACRYGVPPLAALHSLSASGLKRLPPFQASARLLPPEPPENLACGSSSTTLSRSPSLAPGRTATTGKPIHKKHNKQKERKIAPDRLRMPSTVSVPLPGSDVSQSIDRHRPTLNGQSQTYPLRQPPDRLRMPSAVSVSLLESDVSQSQRQAPSELHRTDRPLL